MLTERRKQCLYDMCTYQENLGEDGYFDLLQESNPTSMKSVADVMDPTCLLQRAQWSFSYNNQTVHNLILLGNT